MQQNLIIIVIILGLGFQISPGQSQSPGGDSAWKLVWSDEFSEPEINLSHWNHEVNAWGGGNNELQYYTNRSENSFIRNGTLVIQARKEAYTGTEGTRDFTSARLRTLNLGDWKYGKFEFSAKLPDGKGLWPAIWLLPTDNTYGGWAASGEVDIMELKGQEPATVYGTLHYGGPWPLNTYSGTTYSLLNRSFADDFHTFTLEWESEEFRWYVDGELYQTQTSWSTINRKYPAPFDQRFHIILNVAVGGNFPGNPTNETTFPKEMIIDYVHVFQRNG